MESGDAVDIIYLDFRKAFDSVPHGRLLIKLQKFGIVGNLLKIVEDFLLDRWMAVRVGSAISSITKLFADDVKLIGNAERPDKIQEDLNSLMDWEYKWCMSFNVTKCFVMHIGMDNKNYNYLLNGNVLESVLRESDLGVKMSSKNKCDWKDQIEEAVGKANRMASWVFCNTVS
jgi:hypothetical protein